MAPELSGEQAVEYGYVAHILNLRGVLTNNRPVINHHRLASGVNNFAIAKPALECLGFGLVYLAGESAVAVCRGGPGR